MLEWVYRGERLHVILPVRHLGRWEGGPCRQERFPFRPVIRVLGVHLDEPVQPDQPKHRCTDSIPYLLGFESGKIIGLSHPSAIALITSSVNAPACVEHPIKIVGLTFLIVSSSPISPLPFSFTSTHSSSGLTKSLRSSRIFAGPRDCLILFWVSIYACGFIIKNGLQSVLVDEVEQLICIRFGHRVGRYNGIPQLTGDTWRTLRTVLHLARKL